MDNRICYLNTDLDLTSSDDLTELAAVFAASGVRALHVTKGDDGLWYATFETEMQHSEPEPNVAAMLAAIESLEGPLAGVWMRSIRREFNVGYDCGIEPWEFNQGLSSKLLGRTAAVGASLRITLYPDRAARTL